MIIHKDELMHKVHQSNIPFKDEVFYLISTLKENEIEFRRVNDGDLFADKFLRGNYLIEFPTDDIFFQDKFCNENPDFLETGYFTYVEANRGLNAICPGLDKNLNVVFCVIHSYHPGYPKSMKLKRKSIYSTLLLCIQGKQHPKSDIKYKRNTNG